MLIVLCATVATKVDDETYSGGLWILSREPVLSPEGLTAARQALTDKGYTLSRLRDVEQVKICIAFGSTTHFRQKWRVNVIVALICLI
jgi:hypothetical protein